MVNLEVKNIKNVEAALNKYGKDAILEFEEVIAKEAGNMVIVAKHKAPADLGTLQQSITSQKVTNLHYNVGTNEPYAPFQEFGTRGLVEIPKGWEEMARPFKANPLTKETNVPPHPFMYPAYLIGRKTYAKEMKSAIKRLNKDFNNG